MENELAVFLGPNHMAGILWEYRQGLKNIGVDAKVVVFKKHRFQYPADIEFNFPENKYIKFLKRILMIFFYLPKFIYEFDIFHFVYGASMLWAHIDVYILKLFRKKIVVHFVGSDIRPEDSLQSNEKKKKKIRFWEKYADAIISFPEYSQFLTKKYYLIPLGYNLDYWKPFNSKTSENKDKLLIIHAPSNRRKKGTEYILGAVESLKKEGYNIAFKLLENLPNSKVREWLNKSDIVVDQLIIGWYGAFAIESMAMANPTLCNIDENVKEKVPYAGNLPLVNTNPENLLENLKMLIESSKLRQEIGEKSRKYVEEFHDSKKVAKKLLELYKNL